MGSVEPITLHVPPFFFSLLPSMFSVGLVYRTTVTHDRMIVICIVSRNVRKVIGSIHLTYNILHGLAFFGVLYCLDHSFGHRSQRARGWALKQSIAPELQTLQIGFERQVIMCWANIGRKTIVARFIGTGLSRRRHLEEGVLMLRRTHSGRVLI